MFYSARILWFSLNTAFLLSALFPAQAQGDLNAAKQAVRDCVARVRQDASRRENYDQFGHPPMWSSFDAYVSPDGRVHNNAKFVGEQDGVYRFEKCLAERAFSLGSQSTNSPSKPSDTCTQEELNFNPGECWTKLSSWEKTLAFGGFQSGWLQSYHFADTDMAEAEPVRRLRTLLLDLARQYEELVEKFQAR